MINTIKQELEILKSIRNGWFTEPYYMAILGLIQSIKKIKICYYSTMLHNFVEISDTKKNAIIENLIAGYVIDDIDPLLLLEGLIKEKEWEVSYYKCLNIKESFDILGKDELICIWERFHFRSFINLYIALLNLRYGKFLKKRVINIQYKSPLNDIIKEIGEDLNT